MIPDRPIVPASRVLDTPRRAIHQGETVDLGLETATLPDGRRVELEIVRHPGGAAVVALDDRERVCLLRQYRHAAGGWLWELPAGKIDPDEAPADTARRELGEEAGLAAARWTDLGRIITTPGFCDEVIHLYLARDLTPVPRAHEDDELIECHWVPLQEALARIRSGALWDAKTVLGLYYARGRLAAPAAGG